MTVAQLIKKLEKVKNQDMLVVVSDSESDGYALAKRVVKQKDLYVYDYNEDIMDVEELEIDCIVIE